MKIGDKVQLTLKARKNFYNHNIIGATTTVLHIKDRKGTTSLITISKPLLITSTAPYTIDQSWIEVVEDPVVFEL